MFGSEFFSLQFQIEIESDVQLSLIPCSICTTVFLVACMLVCRDLFFCYSRVDCPREEISVYLKPGGLQVSLFVHAMTVAGTVHARTCRY